MQNKGNQKNAIYRKTSAEIVKEAQSTLSLSTISGIVGAKLVSTRRPITPNVNNRQLYGSSFSNANRPPSAFNLKYLQHEMRALPSLEPINHAKIKDVAPCGEDLSNQKVRRSNSIDTIHEQGGVKAKLPALVESPISKLAAESVENGE
jgi:hypothetical protein